MLSKERREELGGREFRDGEVTKTWSRAQIELFDGGAREAGEKRWCPKLFMYDVSYKSLSRPQAAGTMYLFSKQGQQPPETSLHLP
jgi:hypothetical protein